ncbi:MAG: 16S rRNA (guanine527-N7)-methyltransferase [Saprospiraceae bacterium]|jgi:16S rRNA (guanine527-N7)-methyltransferase
MAFDFSPLLTKGLQKMGVAANEQQTQYLLTFLDMLDKSRKKINLVSVDAPERLVSHHLLDSFSVLPYVVGDRVLDFGTGAGFPGLPLACVNANRHYTLLDSRSRRIEFLQYVCQISGISNVQLLAMRVQGLLGEEKNDAVSGDSTTQGQTNFDTLVSRAVASMQDLLDMTAHLHQPGCRFIAMKGQNPEAELENISVSLPYNLQVKRIKLPDSDAQRHLVIIDFNK